jgi:hypothetical protein
MKLSKLRSYYNGPPMNTSHGNFHFFPNDKIKFGKRGSFIIYLTGLSTVYERIRSKHFRNRSESIIEVSINSRKEWQEFNRSLQSVIDNKLQELEQ